MTGLNSARVIVAGAGALGASIALELARAGAGVVLADPAAAGDNASGIAAGMLAPAFEALLDEGATPHFAVLRAARDLWAGHAEGLGDIGLRRSGAVWVDLPDVAPRIDMHAGALAALGVKTERLSGALLQARVPGLAADLAPGLFTAEDWRLEPRRALAALHEAAVAAGVRMAARSVLAFEPGAARLSGGETLAADQLVLAVGASRVDLAPELAVLSPIKGQILNFVDDATEENWPVVRCNGGYAVWARDGLRVGATMEPGRADRQVTDDATVALRRLSGRLIPALNGAAFTGRAGVRAATPDGLPLVGPSSRPGVFLAAGARRNGWLLAPLVAQLTASYLADRDPGPHAGPMAARRFAPR
jgi:glycine oxidase